MGTLEDEMKNEFRGMSTPDLEGLRSQGRKAIEDYVRGIAPLGHPEELVKHAALDILGNVKEELSARSKEGTF